MNNRLDVSVVISTYNRCDLLADALTSVLAQDAGDVRYEVVVVDNNSTDQTHRVVESLMAQSRQNLRYVFEPRQGLSHARNCGINHALAPIIAFTDDDIRAESNWIATMKRTFELHPQADFIGGKVLPRWNREPPVWLIPDHWDGPLALLNFGDEPFYTSREKPRFFYGANFAFRREVFERVGFFSLTTQRIKDSIGSVEDAEFQLRIYGAGGQGLYAPEVVVTADVQVERMTKAYLRRWYTGNGRYCAMMHLYEIIGPDGKLRDTPPDTSTLFGTPAYVYREFLLSGLRYLTATARRQESESFKHENRVRYFVNYIRQRRLDEAARTPSAFNEIASFAAHFLRRKLAPKRIKEDST